LVVPLAAVTVTVELPTAALDDAAIPKEDPWTAPDRLKGGMIEGTVVTPAGRPETLRLIVWLNPFRGVAETTCVR
jgi:hypothetical protein